MLLSCLRFHDVALRKAKQPEERKTLDPIEEIFDLVVENCHIDYKLHRYSRKCCRKCLAPICQEHMKRLCENFI
uniref:Uncharacterized protein n=1 Tax=Romanomermis culicivorax TaxID=13658 RepID=A0A915HY29_ROMCU